MIRIQPQHLSTVSPAPNNTFPPPQRLSFFRCDPHQVLLREGGQRHVSEMKMDRSSLDLGMAGISGKVGIFMAMSPKISPIVIIGERFQQETFFRISRKKHVDLLLNMKLSPCFTNKDGDFLSCGWETPTSSLAPHLIGNMDSPSSSAPS